MKREGAVHRVDIQNVILYIGGIVIRFLPEL